MSGELTEEQEDEIWRLAGNHIILFLRWIMEKGLEGEEGIPEDGEAVRAGKMTAADDFVDALDCKLPEGPDRRGLGELPEEGGGSAGPARSPRGTGWETVAGREAAQPVQGKIRHAAVKCRGERI